MKSPQILYLITRTHGLRTRLLTESDYENLLRAKTLVELANYLLKTDYVDEVSKIPLFRLTAGRLEKIVNQKLVKRFLFLEKIAPKNVRRFLRAYATRFEVANLKRILRAVHRGERITEELLIPLPRELSTVNTSVLAASKSVEEFAEMLKGTRYDEVSKRLPAYEQLKSTLVLEAALDDAYYSELWDVLEKTIDAASFRDIVGLELDLKNIASIVQLKAKGAEKDLIKEALIRLRYKLSSEAISQMLEARLVEVPDILKKTAYSYLAPKVREAIELQDFSLLDTSLKRAFFDHVAYVESYYAIKPSFVLVYLVQCEYEAHNLTKIVLGKELGIETEEIRKSIVLRS